MRALFEYIFPDRCVNCSRIIHQNMPLCLVCFGNLSFTHWELDNENPTFQLIENYVPIKNASSLLKYQFDSVSQKLIVSNKYYHQPKIGVFLADLAFPALQNHEFDLLLCIPSHQRTLRHRGYNQVTSFSKRLAELMELEFKPEILKRVKRRDSQVHRNWKERHSSLENAFQVSDEIKLYKKILLLDDVLTSGATISNCCMTILEKKSVDISVYTMAKTT